MLLVKNKLKRLKKTNDDDDMLNYLKYSHIDILNDNNENNNNNNQNKNIEDKATQFPEMMNKSTQTKGRETSEKGVDTGNDFGEVTPLMFLLYIRKILIEMKKWFRYGQRCLKKTLHHHHLAVAVVVVVVKVFHQKPQEWASD